MSRVLLVKPITQYCYTIAPNLGLGYLAASLQKAGHDVDMLDCDKKRMTLERFDRYIQGSRYDLVGFQLYTNSLYTTKMQMEAVRRRMKDALIIAGGPHASGDPRQTLAYLKEADMVVTGEGEDVICKIARLEKRDLKWLSALKAMDNIAYRDGGEARLNTTVPIDDLDAVPMPAWGLMDPRDYPEAPHGTFSRAFPIAPIITSRGCPYMCTFCASFTIHGKRIRRRSPRGVLEEMEYLHKVFGVKEFHIEDDNFTMDKDYAKEILGGIVSRGLHVWISLPNGVRIDALDEEMLRLMERAGCYSFGIGIESGSDRILKSLQKSLTTKDIEEKTLLVKRCTKIKITGFFLMGHPEETEDDIMKSIEFALRLKLDRVSFSPLMPLPGSRIYDDWKGRLDADSIDWAKFLYYQFIPSVSAISIERLGGLLREANFRFYMRPHILMGLLKEVRSPHQLKILLKRAARILAG